MSTTSSSPDGIFFLSVQGQIFSAHRLTRSEDDGALHDVFQFAHIAGPGIALQHFHRFGFNAVHRLLEALRILLQEMHGDHGNVFRVLLEPRRINLHDVDAVEEILAEFAFGHQLGQIAMGGEDEPRAQGNKAVAAQAVELHLLEDAQKFYLGEQAEVADFIEEERAVAGLLKVAFASADRAGECAFFMAEEFGFNQRFRDGAAGDGNKRAAGSGSRDYGWRGRSVPCRCRLRR